MKTVSSKVPGRATYVFHSEESGSLSVSPQLRFGAFWFDVVSTMASWPFHDGNIYNFLDSRLTDTRRVIFFHLIILVVVVSISWIIWFFFFVFYNIFWVCLSFDLNCTIFYVVLFSLCWISIGFLICAVQSILFKLIDCLDVDLLELWWNCVWFWCLSWSPINYNL